ncbi:MAG: DNA replication/repair protein RecF [Gammaproteobacteria bacterium]|nr:DNA replication/repair protein RecF [Gammaproteobacteria bacterium]
MILSRLWIQSFRNITDINIELHQRCNVIVGENGSGKTSLIEALYLLSRGQSFRTRTANPLIQFSKDELHLHAKTINDDSLYLHKNQRGQTKVLLNQTRCQRVSDLSKLVPCQLFHQDLFQIIDTASQLRRRLIDWGLFYHQADYVKIYQDFKRVLLQRNMVLKQQGTHDALRAWNKPFLELATKMTAARAAYVGILNQELQSTLAALNLSFDCHLAYDDGWTKANQGLDLSEVLVSRETFDRKYQTTQLGPQHADLLFLTKHGKAKQECSRGQQKVILILLKLIQAKLLAKPCLLLCDDLLAELDDKHLEVIYSELSKQPGQVIMTVLDESKATHPIFADSRWFYLQSGRLDKIKDV